MKRISSSRLSGIALILSIPMVIVGCSWNCNLCLWTCVMITVNTAPCPEVMSFCCMLLCPKCMSSADLRALSQFCEENPDECVATFEQFQIAAIEFCEEYPEECQKDFDACVSFPVK